MKTLHALLVAIKEYPKAAHQLDEPVNELKTLRRFLETHLRKTEFRLSVKELTDRQATRLGVIGGFDHFAGARAGDVCLFFFAGHGSWVKAPAALVTREGDARLESIVCYDSRQPGGYDLIDKELSYLIWKATQGGKDVDFLAIMDCCFSGDNTRVDQGGEDRKTRTISPNFTSKPVAEFYGYKEYTSRYTSPYPPRGNHIQLSACGPNEEAIDGAFTHYLLKELENKSGRSFQEVLLAVRGATKGGQHPQLFSSNPEWVKKAFLFGAI